MESVGMRELELSSRTLALLRQESQYSVGGFRPPPAFIDRAEGVHLWDVDGKEYIDFISMFSATNLGHCHPHVLKKVTEQMWRSSLVNTSTHNSLWPPFAEMMCRRFRFDKICAVITGTEAADTACKIARRWGIKVKGIPATQCTVLGVGGSYHGLAASVWPLMDPSPSRADYGIMSKVLTNVNPTTGERLTYLNLDAMRTCFEDHHERIAAVIMEPLHGCSRSSQDEIVYARGVYDLCRQYNVLFIADEVRQGTAKTGTFFSYQHLGEDCQPDMVTLGKSITAGIYPHAFILGTNAVMSLVGQEHVASTYAMTPVAIVAAQATLEAIDHDNLMERAVTLGKKWRGIIEGWGKHHNIDYVASIGADSNLVMKTGSGYRLAALCMHKGLITYPRPNGLRLSFALTMKDEDLEQGADIIKEALDQLDEYTDVPGENFPC